MTNFEKYNNILDKLVFVDQTYDARNRCWSVIYVPKHSKSIFNLGAGVCANGDVNYSLMKWGLQEALEIEDFPINQMFKKVANYVSSVKEYNNVVCLYANILNYKQLDLALNSLEFEHRPNCTCIKINYYLNNESNIIVSDIWVHEFYKNKHYFVMTASEKNYKEFEENYLQID